jgi:integrase
LAKFTELAVDISSYGRGYSPAKVEIRDLPTDEDIVNFWDLIPNKSWQNAYALMAAFGLRPHEIMHLDLTELPILKVLEDTKTGVRVVRPLRPEWTELFGLNSSLALPRITATTNRELGGRVSKQMALYAMPFPCYNLRHAYAARCSVSFGIPVAISARMLGHSAAVHEATYLRHIREEMVDAVYQGAIASQRSRA